MKVAAGKRERESLLNSYKRPDQAGPENRRERRVFWGNWGS